MLLDLISNEILITEEYKNYSDFEYINNYNYLNCFK